MPQGVSLHIPFPSRISPDFDRALACHLDWPRAFGLLTTPVAERRHLDCHYCELGARFHPSATGADLDLAIDQQSWYFTFDDHFDRPAGDDPAYARKLTAAVAAALAAPTGGTPPDAGTAFAAAFADLWRRSREGMSAVWATRAAAHWHAYLRAHVTEAVNRDRGTVPSFADQLALRRDTVGVLPVLDLAERVGHFEVAELAHRSPLVSQMCRVAEELVILDNDIVSLEKEEAGGEPNLVLQLQRENSWSRAHTITMIAKMIRGLSVRFLALEGQLSGLYRELDLDERQRESLHLYRTDALRTLMRGAHDWGLHSGRYTVAPAVDVPARTADPSSYETTRGG